MLWVWEVIHTPVVNIAWVGPGGQSSQINWIVLEINSTFLELKKKNTKKLGNKGGKSIKTKDYKAKKKKNWYHAERIRRSGSLSSFFQYTINTQNSISVLYVHEVLLNDNIS